MKTTNRMTHPSGPTLWVTVALIGYGGAVAHASEPVTAVDSNEGQLEEIVITAQRRSEDLQKSSLALQVIRGEDLAAQGITEPKDLSSVVPGLVIGTGGSQPQIYIRGVGDLSSIALSNPAVATNLDGIYIARPGDINGSFFDLARVEVLKGPQGTLYGRNASGGAMNLISNAPTLDAPSGHMSVEGGNFSNFNTDGAINVPLSNELAVRAAFQVVSRDGYLSDGFDDDKHQSLRVQGFWKPSDVFSVLLGADYTHLGGNGGGFVYRPSPAGTSPWEGVTSAASNALLNQAAVAASLCVPAAAFPPGVAPTGGCPRLMVAPGVALPQVTLFSPLDGSTARQNSNFWGVHAEVNADLGFATLTVLPAYRHSSESYTTFPAYPFFQDPSVSNESTFEARLSANTERTKWVTGLYYYNERQSYLSGVDAGLIQNARYDVSAETQSYAAFGQVAQSITDDWRLIGGVRYTQDRRYIDGQTDNVFPAVSTNPANICLDPAVALCPTETFQGSHDFTNTTWKVGTEYDIAPQSMLYFTASTGFKAGGFDQNVAPVPAGTTQAELYQPEKLFAYELGSRNRFFDNHLQANLEAFYWIYKDHQEPHVIIDGAGNAAFGFVNAGEAKLYGLDPDVLMQLSSHDTLRVLGEYLQSKYTSFVYTSAVPVGTSCGQTSSGGTYLINCTGDQLAHASKWSGTVRYDHEFPLPNGAQIVTSLDASAASWKWLQIEFTPAERAPGYVTEDASLTYESSGHGWSVMTYVRNIGDKAVYTSGNANAFGPQLFAADIGPPRTFGVRVTVQF